MHAGITAASAPFIRPSGNYDAFLAADSQRTVPYDGGAMRNGFTDPFNQNWISGFTGDPFLSGGMMNACDASTTFMSDFAQHQVGPISQDLFQNFQPPAVTYPMGPLPTPAPAPAPAVPQPANMQRSSCRYGCSATFGRHADYRRHMLKHEKPRYRCPMIECGRTFHRVDKMRDHVKRGHKSNILSPGGLA